MAQNLSQDFIVENNKLNPDESILWLIEINHPALSTPARFVNDRCDLTSNGNAYLASSFTITKPDEGASRTPTCQLEIDNVSNLISHFVEQVSGGLYMTARLIMVRRSQPDVIEYDIEMDFTNISMTRQKISGSLGFEDTLGKSSVPVLYRPENFPGMF